MNHIENLIAKWAGTLSATTPVTTSSDYIVALTVHGQDSGMWIIEMGSSPIITATDQSRVKSDCEIKISDKDLISISQGTMTPQALFTDGRLIVRGDPGVALEFCKSFWGAIFSG